MDKSEAVTIIRSLLTSSQTSINVETLNLEFRSVTGSNIPIFEHVSLEDFLLSIPETVVVTGISPNLYVNLVSSNKSSHIVSLVAKQKAPKPKMKVKHRVREVEHLKPNLPSEKVKLHQHLLKCPNGCTLNEIKTLIPELANLESPPKLFNLMNLIKSCPGFVYFNGKLYASDVFKDKISNGDDIFQ